MSNFSFLPSINCPYASSQVIWRRCAILSYLTIQWPAALPVVEVTGMPDLHGHMQRVLLLSLLRWPGITDKLGYCRK